MRKDEIIREIGIIIDEVGLTGISSIAFGLIQKEAENQSEGDRLAEARALKAIMSRVQESFEEEYRVLMGGEGNTYIAP